MKYNPDYKILCRSKADASLSKVKATLDRQRNGQIDSSQAMEDIKKATAELSDTDEDYQGEQRIQIPDEQRACPSM